MFGHLRILPPLIPFSHSIFPSLPVSSSTRSIPAYLSFGPPFHFPRGFRLSCPRPSTSWVARPYTRRVLFSGGFSAVLATARNYIARRVFLDSVFFCFVFKCTLVFLIGLTTQFRTFVVLNHLTPLTSHF